MPGLEFFRRTYVDYCNVVFAHEPPQFLERHRLELVAPVEVRADHMLHVGEAAVTKGFQRSQETEDILVSQAIVHVGPVAASFDKPRLPKRTKVRAGILDGRCDLRG